MHPRTLSSALLALGWEPRLSPFMLKVVVYKLTFAAALALIAAGAAIGRRPKAGGRVNGDAADTL
jgi:hypothetical protein